MTGTIIQVYGEDEDPFFLLHCSDKDFPEQMLRSSLKAFDWSGDSQDLIEDFITELNTKWAPVTFERLFINTELYL